MEKEQIYALFEKLKEVLGKDISREDLRQKMEKVALHRPTRDTDDIVAACVGLPVEAVTLIRDMIRKLTGGESMQRSRLSYHPLYMRLPLPKNIILEDYKGKSPVCRYADHIKKNREEKEIPNET